MAGRARRKRSPPRDEAPRAAKEPRAEARYALRVVVAGPGPTLDERLWCRGDTRHVHITLLDASTGQPCAPRLSDKLRYTVGLVDGTGHHVAGALAPRETRDWPPGAHATVAARTLQKGRKENEWALVACADVHVTGRRVRPVFRLSPPISPWCAPAQQGEGGREPAWRSRRRVRVEVVATDATTWMHTVAVTVEGKDGRTVLAKGTVVVEAEGHRHGRLVPGMRSVDAQVQDGHRVRLGPDRSRATMWVRPWCATGRPVDVVFRVPSWPGVAPGCAEGLPVASHSLGRLHHAARRPPARTAWERDARQREAGKALLRLASPHTCGLTVGVVDIQD